MQPGNATMRETKISNALMTRTIQGLVEKMIPFSVFQKLAEEENVAAKECIETYEDFIYALARKFTSSPEEAAAAAHEIFVDIWRYAERCDDPPSAEEISSALTARQRLVGYLK